MHQSANIFDCFLNAAFQTKPLKETFFLKQTGDLVQHLLALCILQSSQSIQ